MSTKDRPVSVSKNHRDRHGNAGQDEIWGDYATVAEAKAAAEAMARTNLSGSLSWRQFSDTTWGLMQGNRYTDVLVSDNSKYLTEDGAA